jgi:hypothetical protein
VQQIAIGVQISAFFLIIAVRCRPYARRMNNTLYIAVNCCILATFSIALLISDRIDTQRESQIITNPTVVGLMLLFINVMIPLAVIVLEIGRIRIGRPDDEATEQLIDGIPWPFARWEKSGKRFGRESGGPSFQGAKPGDAAEHALLRRELEYVKTSVLLDKSLKCGVNPSSKERAALGADPKFMIIEFIMEEVRLEGQGWGWSRTEEGVIRNIFIEDFKSKAAVRKRNKARRELQEAADHQAELAMHARFAKHGKEAPSKMMSTPSFETDNPLNEDMEFGISRKSSGDESRPDSSLEDGSPR